MEQLLLFEDPLVERQAREVARLREDLQKLRKAQFGEIAKAKKLAEQAINEVEMLKAAICRNQPIYSDTFLDKCG